MAVPLSTNTVSIHRLFPPAGPPADGYDANPPAPRCIETGLRATISPPSGSTRLVGGERVVYDTKMYCDTTDLQTADTVTDERDGTVWTVLNVRRIESFGFSHMTASLREVEGYSS